MSLGPMVPGSKVLADQGLVNRPCPRSDLLTVTTDFLQIRTANCFKNINHQIRCEKSQRTIQTCACKKSTIFGDKVYDDN